MISTAQNLNHETTTRLGGGYGYTGVLGSSLLPSFHKLMRDTPPPLAQLAMAFTSKQRAELEHQVLLAKYLVANVKIPPELLLPLSIQGSLSDRLTTKSIFQGPFSIRDAMGNGNTGAAQHTRCLRTDGKKWQCKKAVVPGQKYCEKHMHRGRHRSLLKKGEGPSGLNASGDSLSDSLSSQDRSKASDSQQLPGSDEGPAKKAKLEKRDSVNSQANAGKQRQENSMAIPRPRSPALPKASAEPSARFPSTSSFQNVPPVGHAEFRELYTAAFSNVPGRQPPPPAPKFSHLYTGRSFSEPDRMQELTGRGLVKPEHDHVGTPPLSSQVFSNGHAAAFASARIGRDGTALSEYNPELTMAILLREERAKLDREAIAAGLGYRGTQANQMDPPRDHNLRLQFEDYRSGLPTFSDARASSALDAYRPASAHWTQPQVSPSSPSQWQLATSALLRDPQGTGSLPRSFSRNLGGASSPKTGSLQRQGSEPLGRMTSLQRQHSDPLTLTGNGMLHSGDASQDGLPPHLAFLAKNNNAGASNMQPFDEERGLVRTHSLVKGGSLANRHGHRSILSRQPSMHSDDPERPWLAVSMGRGWEVGMGGPLGEALRRTASGTPVQPEDKPGKGSSAGGSGDDDFRLMAEQFVSEPLGPELPSQSDLPGATANKKQGPSSVKNTGFESFSLDGKSEGYRGKGFEGADLNELGEGPQLIAGT